MTTGAMFRALGVLGRGDTSALERWRARVRESFISTLHVLTGLTLYGLGLAALLLYSVLIVPAIIMLGWGVRLCLGISSAMRWIWRLLGWTRN